MGRRKKNLLFLVLQLWKHQRPAYFLFYFLGKIRDKIRVYLGFFRVPATVFSVRLLWIHNLIDMNCFNLIASPEIKHETNISIEIYCMIHGHLLFKTCMAWLFYNSVKKDIREAAETVAHPSFPKRPRTSLCSFGTASKAKGASINYVRGSGGGGVE